MSKLNDRVAVVTGATGGIGFEVAKRLGIMPEGSNIMEIKSGVSKTIKLKKR